MKKILLFIALTFGLWFCFQTNSVFAVVNIPGTNEIRDVSLNI